MFSSVIFLLVTSLSLGSESWIIREEGTGPVKIGMTVNQLRKVLQQQVGPSDAPSGDDSCFYLQPKGHPHISFMIIDNRLVRIDVDHAGIVTSTRIQIGDSEARALKMYAGRIEVSPHKYIDNGHYLTAKSADGKYGIRFETENGKITSFYSGTYEAIQYVEGCL